MKTSPIAAALAGTLAATSAGMAGGLIINEWNCVGSEKWLGNPGTTSCEGPAGITCSDQEDTFFGRIMGNGGNWVELVVTEDKLDIRGWQLRWREGNADGTGEVIWWPNGNFRQGVITFSNDPLWANLRAGTIITIIEKDTAEGGLDTDVSFDPCIGDWWININSYDKQYVTAIHNRPDRPDGYFSVDNEDWEGRIVDTSANPVSGPVGEAVPGWEGGGINSREAGKLQAAPSSFVTIDQYDDSNSSTFGKPNRWTELISIFPEVTCPQAQDFSVLRASYQCPCNRVILNEYNAVANANWLNGGDANGDDDGGFASDSFFGRVQGNGGNWFELVVTGNNVDMRGWVLFWEEVLEDKWGTLTLSQDPTWSSLQAGTIITFIERSTVQGGLNTDISYTLPGGNWININTSDTQYVASFHSEDPAPGRMSVGHDDWRLTIFDASSQRVFGPAGEGAAGYGGRGISSREVGLLAQDPSGNVQAYSNYIDGIHSTFGSANMWPLCTVSPSFTSQNFNNLIACDNVEPHCPADLNGDGNVDVSDLLQLFSSWGACGSCAADLNGDGFVDVSDLLALLGAWGPCSN